MNTNKNNFFGSKAEYDSGNKTYNYEPTLIIGVGGTGIKTLRFLKRELSVHKGALDNIKILGIDTDNTEISKYTNVAEFEDDEFIVLDAEEAKTIVEQIDETASDDDNSLEHTVSEFLPNTNPENGYQGIHGDVIKSLHGNYGAGQYRRTGRLLVYSNVNQGSNLKSKLQNINSELLSQVKKIEQELAGNSTDFSQIQVYFVSSASGGSGAGMLIDLVALVRSIFGKKITVALSLVLPGELLDKAQHNNVTNFEQTRGISYGLITEIEQFYGKKVDKYTFKFGENESEYFNYLRGDAFIDSVLLLGQKNQKGSSLNEYIDLCEATSALIYSLTNSGIGKNHNASKINNMAAGGNEFQKEHPAIYKSFGVTTLKFPYEELMTAYKRFEYAKWFNKWLLEPNCSDSDFDELVNTFINTSGLGLRNKTVLSKLTPKKCLTEVKFLATPGAIEQSIGRNVSDNELFAKVDHKTTSFDLTLDEQSMNGEGGFTDNKKKIVEEVCLRLRREVLSLGTGSGLTLQRFNDEIDSYLVGEQSISNERLKVIDRDLSTLETDFKPLKVKILKGFDGLPSYLRGDKSFREQYLVKIQKLLKLRLERVQVLFYLQVVDEIKHDSMTYSKQISHMSATLRNHLDSNENSLDKELSGKMGTALVIPLLDPSEFSEWYDKHQFDFKPKFNISALSLEDLENQFLQDLEDKLKEQFWDNTTIESMIAENPELITRIKTLLKVNNLMFEFGDLKSTGLKMPTSGQLGVELLVNSPISQNKLEKLGVKNNISLSQSANKHKMTCVSLGAGFSYWNWKLAPESKSFFEKDSWVYTALDIEDKDESAESLFGLALGLGLIVKHGASRYYFNLKQDYDQFSFESWEKSFPKNTNDITEVSIEYQGLAYLVENEIVTTNHVHVDDIPVIGKSLEKAIDFFCSSKAKQQREFISEVIDKLITEIGNGSYCKYSETFTEWLTSKYRKTGNTANGKIWLRICNQMKRYITEIK